MFFDNIMSVIDIDFSDIFLDKKSYENIILDKKLYENIFIYKISYKISMGANHCVFRWIK